MQIFAVCPFLAVDNANSRQQFLRLVTRQPRILGSAAALLGSLPLSVRRWVVTSYASALEPHALEAALGLLQWQPAVNALHLAKHEFNDLDSPAEWWLLKQFGERWLHALLLLLFCSAKYAPQCLQLTQCSPADLESSTRLCGISHRCTSHCALRSR